MKNVVHLKLWLLCLTLISIHQIVWSQNTSVLNFDGNDFFQINDVSDKLDVTGGDYTIELWFYSDNSLVLGEKRVLMSRKGSWELYIQKNHSQTESVIFATLDSGGFTQRWEILGSLNPNLTDIWTHVAVSSEVISGTRTTRIFLNGGMYTPDTDPRFNTWANDEPIFIGKRDDNSNPYYFQGYMDEIHFQNSARYSAAFAKNILSSPDSKLSSTIFLYDLDENTGTTINNNNDGDFDISFQSTPNDVSWLGWRGNSGDQGLPLNRTFIWRGFYSNSTLYELNWDPGICPSSGDDVIVPGYATNDYEFSEEETATYGTMIIEAGANAKIYGYPGVHLTVSDLLIENSGFLQLEERLTVNNSFINSGGAASFHIKSWWTSIGSLITDQTGVVATVERDIGPYNVNQPGSGWHILSSPVGDFAIAPTNFVPGPNDDFFKYDPIGNMLLTYHNGSFTHMEKGIGYIIAYQNYYMHYYPMQAINVQDVGFNNIPNTSGWALLGNPFSSAIDWNQGTWNRLNIGSPQVYNEDMKSFEPTTVIPPTNGFWVQVTNPVNAITLPADARRHDPQTWYKSSESNILKLKLSGDQDYGYDKTTISFNNQASDHFDADMDFNKMRSDPIVPQIFSMNGTGDEFNTQAIPIPYGEKIIPLNTHIGYNGVYKIEVLENSCEFESPIYLKDMKTGDLVNLTTTQEYTFVGNVDEAEDRFLLYFNSAVGVDEKESASNLLVYTQNQRLYISSKTEINSTAKVYDLSGRLIQSFKIEGEKHQENTNLSRGVYLIEISDKNIEFSQKFIIN